MNGFASAAASTRHQISEIGNLMAESGIIDHQLCERADLAIGCARQFHWRSSGSRVHRLSDVENVYGVHAKSLGQVGAGRILVVLSQHLPTFFAQATRSLETRFADIEKRQR
jgi:hypothetical protein